MSGTPPFCTLGQKYNVNLFNDSGELLKYDNIDPKIIIQGGRLTQTNDPIDDGGVSLRYSTHITDPANLEITVNCSLKTNYAETFTNGIGIVIKTGSTAYITALMKLVYDPAPISKYKFVAVSPSTSITNTVKTNDFTEYNFSIKVINTPITSEIYLDGVLILTGNPLPLSIGGFHIWPQVQTTTTYDKYGDILDITYLGDAFDNICQGEIPTYHRVAPASTVKLAHYRRIAEHRTPQVAEQFHEIIKATI